MYFTKLPRDLLGSGQSVFGCHLHPASPPMELVHQRFRTVSSHLRLHHWYKKCQGSLTKLKKICFRRRFGCRHLHRCRPSLDHGGRIVCPVVSRVERSGWLVSTPGKVMLQSNPYKMFAADLQPSWLSRLITNASLLFYFLKLYNFDLYEIFVGSTSSEQ